MNVFLMFRDRDVDLQQPLPVNQEELTQDLGLDNIFQAMGNGDPFLSEIARRILLASLVDPEQILYRQYILADCLARPDIARSLYELALDAIQGERRIYRALRSSSPELILHRSIEVMRIFIDMLQRLRQIAVLNATSVKSEGFNRFFAMVLSEIDDAYLESVEAHLQTLAFKRGMLMGASLGPGNKGTNFVLHSLPTENWWEKLVPKGPSGYSFSIPARDEGATKALSELESRGIDVAANALAQSVDHILAFFTQLRDELAFYMGCLHLRDRLTAQDEPIAFPTPAAPGRVAFAAHDLYDVALALVLGRKVVGNDIEGDGKALFFITGANQGGKSTFLRSVGQAQLMMQCGMFVSASQLDADVRVGMFTHFKREEDARMKSGKLDEELARMSDIVAQIGSHSLLLFNESFASTNEREGSEIARQIVRALLESGVKVFYVTHLYDLAQGFFRLQLPDALFLRAPRLPSGERTFQLQEGEPLPTSFGGDSYQRIFGEAPGVESEEMVEADVLVGV